MNRIRHARQNAPIVSGHFYTCHSQFNHPLPLEYLLPVLLGQGDDFSDRPDPLEGPQDGHRPPPRPSPHRLSKSSRKITNRGGKVVLCSRVKVTIRERVKKKRKWATAEKRNERQQIFLLAVGPPAPLKSDDSANSFAFLPAYLTSAGKKENRRTPLTGSGGTHALERNTFGTFWQPSHLIQMVISKGSFQRSLTF